MPEGFQRHLKAIKEKGQKTHRTKKHVHSSDGEDLTQLMDQLKMWKCCLAQKTAREISKEKQECLLPAQIMHQGNKEKEKKNVYRIYHFCLMLVSKE